MSHFNHVFSEQVTTNIYVNNSLQIGDRVHMFHPVYNYNLQNNSFFELNQTRNNESKLFAHYKTIYIRENPKREPF